MLGEYNKCIYCSKYGIWNLIPEKGYVCDYCIEGDD